MELRCRSTAADDRCLPLRRIRPDPLGRRHVRGDRAAGDAGGHRQRGEQPGRPRMELRGHSPSLRSARCAGRRERRGDRRGRRYGVVLRGGWMHCDEEHVSAVRVPGRRSHDVDQDRRCLPADLPGRNGRGVRQQRLARVHRGPVREPHDVHAQRLQWHVAQLRHRSRGQADRDRVQQRTHHVDP